MNGTRRRAFRERPAAGLFRHDFGTSPLMFYYEVTLACDLVCKHCRASAQEQPHPAELSTDQAKALLDQVAGFPRRPMLVLTGGDPLKRADLFTLIRHAVAAGLQVALTPSATPLATFEAFARAREAGVRRLGISLDGADAATHDAFRGWPGSFQRTLEMLANARKLGLAVQLNTSITRRNVAPDRRDGRAVGRARDRHVVGVLPRAGRPRRRGGADSRRGVRRGFRTALASRPVPALRGEDDRGPALPAVCAGAAAATRWRVRRGPPMARPAAAIAQPLGVGDGKGIMFVSHTGEIYPAGFLPLGCGRFPRDSVIEVYQKHPVFLALRDPDRLQGPLRHLRVPAGLRRQSRPGVRSHRRLPGIGAGLRVCAAGGKKAVGENRAV